MPAARIGLVAMSFTDAQLGYGVYEPFNPGAAIPPPRLVRTSDGGADWFVVGPTPPAPPSDSVGQIHLVFESQEVGFFWAGGSLYETTDGGRHWHKELSGDATSVSVADGPAWADVRDHCGGASAVVRRSTSRPQTARVGRPPGTSEPGRPSTDLLRLCRRRPCTSCSRRAPGACSASRARCRGHHRRRPLLDNEGPRLRPAAPRGQPDSERITGRSALRRVLSIAEGRRLSERGLPLARRRRYVAARVLLLWATKGPRRPGWGTEGCPCSPPRLPTTPTCSPTRTAARMSRSPLTAERPGSSLPRTRASTSTAACSRRQAPRSPSSPDTAKASGRPMTAVPPGHSIRPAICPVRHNCGGPTAS